VLRRLWKRPRARARHPDAPSAESWRISFGRVFHRNCAAKEKERFPVSSLTDGLKRVTTDVERVDLGLVGMVRSHRRQRGVLCCKEEYVREMSLYWMRCSTFSK